MTVDVITFGCRLNVYESNIIKNKATAAGLQNTFIMNSCAVTSEAERQLRQTIRKIRKNNPDAKIIVTGCAAQINAEKYAALAEIDIVIGNAEKLDATTYEIIAKTAKT
jgi:threonylcarbamoyladenosine tRNA methylthiotransferase MtaB